MMLLDTIARHETDMLYITRVSHFIHNLIFKDTSESLCSRAWRLQHRSRFWKVWTYVFGRRHCAASFDRYWFSPDPQTDQHQSH